MRRISLLLLSLNIPFLACAQSHTVRIGVLGIFHPQQLTLAADPASELLISAGDQRLYLKPHSECNLLHIRSSANHLLLICGGKQLRASQIRASSRNQQATGLVLGVPGKIKRRYEGFLELKANHGELVPVVTMDLETAVASVVQAETLPGTPLDALEAQAVVTRSYFVAASGRHSDFGFCDLTHCQFLREPPPADSPAASATAATRGLVLTYNGKVVPAMFTRSCSGRTRRPEEIGLSQGTYPYFSVECEFCYNNPVRWTRTVSPEDANGLQLHGENARLAIGRRLGWDAVPSDNFTVHQQGNHVILQGRGQGHGIGLCQRGARDMAEHGSAFRAILEHYFPNTRCQELPAVP